MREEISTPIARHRAVDHTVCGTCQDLLKRSFFRLIFSRRRIRIQPKQSLRAAMIVDGNIVPVGMMGSRLSSFLAITKTASQVVN
jgi:hypothetical protein